MEATASNSRIKLKVNRFCTLPVPSLKSTLVGGIGKLVSFRNKQTSYGVS